MKRTVFSLIPEEFPNLGVLKAKALTETDRHQLASAIARQRGLLPEQIDFVIVPYQLEARRGKAVCRTSNPPHPSPAETKRCIRRKRCTASPRSSRPFAGTLYGGRFPLKCFAPAHTFAACRWGGLSAC